MLANASRGLSMPSCGGMWVPRPGIENSVIGERPAVCGIGADPTAAAVVSSAGISRAGRG